MTHIRTLSKSSHFHQSDKIQTVVHSQTPNTKDQKLNNIKNKRRNEDQAIQSAWYPN